MRGCWGQTAYVKIERDRLKLTRTNIWSLIVILGVNKEAAESELESGGGVPRLLGLRANIN